MTRALHAAAPLLASLMILAPLGCGSKASAPDSVEAQAKADEDDDDVSGEEAAPQPTLKDLGPNARRVTVIVLPGDASVEVDGSAARRRDGVIELTGQVNDKRRLRVFKGLQSAEQEVKIEDTGANPALVDLNARPAVVPGQGGPAAPGPKAPVDPLLVDQFQ